MRNVWMGLALVVLAACGGDSPTEPDSPPTPTLDGRWVGSVFVPFSYDPKRTYLLTLDLTLAESARSVTGNGSLSADGVVAFALVVKQGVNTYPDFSLLLGSSGVQDMALSGRFNHTTELLGSLNGSGYINQLIVLRRQ